MVFRGVINGSESRIFRAGLLSLHQHFRKEKHLAFLCLVKPPFLTISMHRISGMPTAIPWVLPLICILGAWRFHEAECG